jgi:hypothetical protein
VESTGRHVIPGGRPIDAGDILERAFAGGMQARVVPMLDGGAIGVIASMVSAT